MNFESFIACSCQKIVLSLRYKLTEVNLIDTITMWQLIIKYGLSCYRSNSNHA